MRITLSVKLNLGDDEQNYIAEQLRKEESVSSGIVQALRFYYIERYNEPQNNEPVVVEQDNKEVLDAIARIDSKLEALTRRGIVTEQETAIMPGGIEATFEEIDPNADTPFLNGLRKNTFRPGMRLDTPSN